jgi:hypothetical protein
VALDADAMADVERRFERYGQQSEE